MVKMLSNGDTTTTTGLTFTLTDALKGASCLTCTSDSAPFWRNAATIASAGNSNSNSNSNGMDPKLAVVPLAVSYPSQYYYRPSCPKQALGGVVSGVVMGGTFSAAMAISSGMDRRMMLGYTARNAVGFGLWTGTFRGTKCGLARSGIPGTDGVLGATAAGGATGAFLTLALTGFNMRVAQPALARNTAACALLGGVFELINSV